MNVSLTPRLERFTRDLVESGRYRSASEVLREALRLLEDREAQTADLRRLVEKGLGSEGRVQMTREDIRGLIGERMDQLQGEVERGERPPPSAAHSSSA